MKAQMEGRIVSTVSTQSAVWKNVKLGEIAESIQTGPFGSQLHQSDYSDNGTPVIMPKDIVDGGISTETIARVDEQHVERLSRHKVTEGEIVYSRRGDVGKCAYITKAQEGWLCGTGCLKVTINKSDANPKFIFYQLQKESIVGWLEKHAKGATMANLNTSILSDVPLELPSISIQNNIVDTLSRYDALISNYQHQIKLLEEAAQRLYKEWFVDLHFPGHENVKVTDGVPEGWEKKKIKDVCETIQAGGTPSRRNETFWNSKDYYWVKTKELADNWILSSEEFISEEGLEHSSAKLFPQETILMAIYASPTLGRLGILATECTCNQAALGLVVNRSFVSYQWLYLKLQELRDYFNSVARGAGQQNINGDVVKNKDIICPSKYIMDAFTRFVSSFFDNIRNLQHSISLLTESRDRMLPKLMSGEIEL